MNEETSSPRFLFRKIGLTSAALLISALAGCATAPAGDDAAFYVYGGAVPGTPGTLLRSEPLPARFGLEAAAQQWRILYTSTDGRTGSGQLVTSGAVFYPKGPMPAGGWPIVAWAHGTTGISDDCAPSRRQRSRRDSRYLDACAAGTRVQQHVYPGLSHSETVNASLADSIPFARSLLAGQPVPSTCAGGSD